MSEHDHKLIHAFGALAELGQEVTNKNNFQETIRTSLHLISGALGIMRGAVARYSRFAHELNLLAVRGLGDDFPLSLSLCTEDERQFLTNGLNPIEISQAEVLPFFQVYDNSFERRRLEMFRINAKESAELNKHPAVGYEILQPIHHPYTDVPLAAKYHHERLDGRGYPDGLYDREIPFIAKVVNLADSFDTMTTDRPYKARRPAKDVVEDLKVNAGKQFAPELVTHSSAEC